MKTAEGQIEKWIAEEYCKKFKRAFSSLLKRELREEATCQRDNDAALAFNTVQQFIGSQNPHKFTRAQVVKLDRLAHKVARNIRRNT